MNDKAREDLETLFDAIPKQDKYGALGCKYNIEAALDHVDELEKENNKLEETMKLIVKLSKENPGVLATMLHWIQDDYFKDETFDDFIAWGGDETPIICTEPEFNQIKEVIKKYGE